MGKKRKTILIIGSTIVFLFLLVLLTPALLGFFAKDIPPIDDSDLHLERVFVPQEENAYYDLIKLSPQTYGEVLIVNEPVEDYDLYLDHLAGKAWNEEFVEDILSKNKEAFQYFNQAAQKPKYQDPALLDPAAISFDTPLVSSVGWRKIARLSSLKALYLAKHGDAVGALNEAVKSVKIGKNIQESQSFLVHYLVAIAMKSIGLEAMQKIITISDFSPEVSIQYIKELERFKEDKEWLKVIFKGEYLSQAKMIDLIATGEIKISESLALGDETLGETVYFGILDRMAKNKFFLQSNKTKSIFAEHARLGLRNAEKLCGFLERGEVKPLVAQSPEGFSLENIIGKMLHDITAVGLSSLNIKGCEDDLLVSTTKLLFALKAYRADFGKLPTSLEELVPKYILSVPEDPFDGEAIKYSAAKKIIYSVGIDLVDSGGSEGEDWREMKDPTFKIDF